MHTSVRVRPFNKRELLFHEKSDSASPISDLLLRPALRVNPVDRAVIVQKFFEEQPTKSDEMNDENNNNIPTTSCGGGGIERRDVSTFSGFNRVFWEVQPSVAFVDEESGIRSTQKDVYDEVGVPAVDLLFKGKNSIVYAHGMTGSGKHYTILGHSDDEGIAPRVLRDSFARLGKLNSSASSAAKTIPQQKPEKKNDDDDDDSQYQSSTIMNIQNASQITTAAKIELMVYQVYLEKITDLLAKDALTFDSKQVRIREKPPGETDPEKIYLDGITTETPSSADEAVALLAKAQQAISVYSTKMGTTSSRSTFVVQLHLHQPGKRSSFLKLIAPSGSERPPKSGATGEVLREASSIGRGLAGFTNCLSAAVKMIEAREKAEKQTEERKEKEKEKEKEAEEVESTEKKKVIYHHIPVRDTQLTRIMQEVFFGRAKLFFIACVGPFSESQIEDTHMTLRTAAMVQRLKYVED